MIHVGVILKALAWQAVGVGMLTKHGVDHARAKHAQTVTNRYYAPLDTWWAKYGSSVNDTSKKVLDACKLAYYDDSWIDYVRSVVTPDNEYIEDMLKNPRMPRYRNHGYPMTMIYYACLGQAANITRFGDLHPVRRVPSGNLFQQQEKPVQELIVKLLEERGVPELYWYTEDVDSIMKRLDELSR